MQVRSPCQLVVHSCVLSILALTVQDAMVAGIDGVECELHPIHPDSIRVSRARVLESHEGLLENHPLVSSQTT